MRPRLRDVFCGSGGAAWGYDLAGFEVVGVDNSRARLKEYPFRSIQSDAVAHLRHIIQTMRAGGRPEFDALHLSPPCTGYTRGTVAIKGREQKYDRLIAVVRDLADTIGVPYVIENVEGARAELRTPALLCGRMFGLSATDTDGTPLVMDRHRLFETNWPLLPPEHMPHDRTLQVAGSYGGARRDKTEARTIRKGGYVPSVDVQRELLGTPWMSEKGCQLSIPPAYTRFIGAQLLEYLERVA